jgi:hypothetical protein
MSVMELNMLFMVAIQLYGIMAAEHLQFTGSFTCQRAQSLLVVHKQIAVHPVNSLKTLKNLQSQRTGGISTIHLAMKIVSISTVEQPGLRRTHGDGTVPTRMALNRHQKQIRIVIQRLHAIEPKPTLPRKRMERP